MSAPVLILLITAAVVVAASFIMALVMNDMPPRQGFRADFVGALLVCSCIAIVGEGLIFGVIRLVRYALTP